MGATRRPWIVGGRAALARQAAELERLRDVECLAREALHAIGRWQDAPPGGHRDRHLQALLEIRLELARALSPE